MDDKLLVEGFVLMMKITNEVTINCLKEILRQQKEHKLETLPDPDLIEMAIKRFNAEQSLMDEDLDGLIETILKNHVKVYKS